MVFPFSETDRGKNDRYLKDKVKKKAESLDRDEIDGLETGIAVHRIGGMYK